MALASVSDAARSTRADALSTKQPMFLKLPTDATAVAVGLGTDGGAAVPDGLMLRALEKQVCSEAPVTWSTPNPQFVLPLIDTEPHWLEHDKMVPTLIQVISHQPGMAQPQLLFVHLHAADDIAGQRRRN